MKKPIILKTTFEGMNIATVIPQEISIMDTRMAKSIFDEALNRHAYEILNQIVLRGAYELIKDNENNKNGNSK